MYGHRQHALHSAGLDLNQAAVTGDKNHRESALAPGQIPPSDLCPGSVWSSGDVGQPSLTTIAIPDTMYSLPLEHLDLSMRLYLLLQRAGIQTVGQVLELDLDSFHQLTIGDKSLQELVHHIQNLNLLDPAQQGQIEEPSEGTPTGRQDNRQRPGRGKLRANVSYQPQPQEQRLSSSVLFGFCYKVPVAQLPLALRLALPRWARCGIEQGEENKTSREELPRRTRFCYVQPLSIGETGELIEWQANPAGDAPSHYRVAATPDALRAASFIKVDAQEAQVLKRELVNAAAPSPLIRVAPACFLTETMRAMIAPAVSFPDAFTVPENATHTRVSLAQGSQVAIPQRVAEMRIEHLSLSAKTHSCLRLAGIMTVGALLELEEERIGTILDLEGLWELYTAVFAKEVLPTTTGILPAEQSVEGVEPMPVWETFYYYPTGATYDDPELGRLYLVHAALFVDRLDGSRSGPVETLWLTSRQIGQSLLWQRELAQLDSLELRTRVTNHAIGRAAVLPQMNRAEDLALERKRQMLEMEEQYTLVPLRSEYKQDAPLELFISEADLKAAEEEHQSPVSTVIRVLERYLEHPHAQPAGHRLEINTLDDMHYWLREDRKEQHRLNAAWKRQFPGQPHPAGPSIVMHEEYVTHKYKEWNEETGRNEVKEITELVGYRLIIGILVRTRVPSELIVEPRLEKPVFLAPERPIQPCRTPAYVPFQQAA